VNKDQDELNVGKIERSSFNCFSKKHKKYKIMIVTKKKIKYSGRINTHKKSRVEECQTMIVTKKNYD